MKARLLLLLACVVALTAAAGTATAATSTSPYVIVYRDGVTDSKSLTSELKSTMGLKVKASYVAALQGFAADLTPEQVSALSSNPDVKFVEPDTTFSAAGLVGVASGEALQPGIRRTGAATATQVHEAASSAVAVLDTGVDLGNADLNAVSGVNCITAGATAKDDNGHGTHVAGILAARNNGSTVVGMAPDTKVYSVKVLNSKAMGTLSQILCGVDWVTANAATLNITVANMSIVGRGSNDDNCGNTNGDAEHKAICRSTAAGVSYVAAAGNSATNFAATVPAAYPEVLTATAMSDTDGIPGRKGPAPSCKRRELDDSYATYSNYAVADKEKSHTVAAPGTCVVSDKPGGGIATYYGTSQAAPHVAGSVALCVGNGGLSGPCAGLTPAQIIQRIRDDARAAATTATGFVGDEVQPLTGRYFGNLVAASGY